MNQKSDYCNIVLQFSEDEVLEIGADFTEYEVHPSDLIQKLSAEDWSLLLPMLFASSLFGEIYEMLTIGQIDAIAGDLGVWGNEPETLKDKMVIEQFIKVRQTHSADDILAALHSLT